MSRDDLLMANYEIVRSATEESVKFSPNSILILVTNPLDAMAQAALWSRSSTRSAWSAWPACWIARASAPSSRRSWECR